MRYPAARHDRSKLRLPVAGAGRLECEALACVDKFVDPFDHRSVLRELHWLRDRMARGRARSRRRSRIRAMSSVVGNSRLAARRLPRPVRPADDEDILHRSPPEPSRRQVGHHRVEHREARGRHAQAAVAVALDQALAAQRRDARVVERTAGERRDSAAGRCLRRAAGPSAGIRRPARRASAARPSIRPWPLASTRISQDSGRFSVAVAWRLPSIIEPAVRAGADAGIFVVAPVDEIVPALGAGARVVGNLVGRQAARRRRSPASRRRARAPDRRPAMTSLPAACSAANGVSCSMVS